MNYVYSTYERQVLWKNGVQNSMQLQTKASQVKHISKHRIDHKGPQRAQTKNTQQI
jgi:hypothetical protein